MGKFISIKRAKFVSNIEAQIYIERERLVMKKSKKMIKDLIHTVKALYSVHYLTEQMMILEQKLVFEVGCQDSSKRK